MSKVYQVTPNGVGTTGLTDSDYVNPDNLTAGQAVEKAQVFLTSEDERFSAGVWECSPCCEVIRSYPGDEFCTVLEGTVIITEGGQEKTYRKGDSFVVKKGADLVWNMTEPFKKYFVMYA